MGRTAGSGPNGEVLTREDLDQWLGLYGGAWEARDGEAAARLFTEDAVYCWGPHDAPTGREAIQGAWSDATGGQRNVRFRHEVLGIDAHRGFARCWSRVVRSGTGVHIELDGVFVLDFDESGLCSQLQEWWLAREQDAD
jgi:hypothetical protein